MRLRVSPRLPRLLAVCLCSLALASAALVGTGVATSHVAHAATAPNTAIRCGAERHDPASLAAALAAMWAMTAREIIVMAASPMYSSITYRN